MNKFNLSILAVVTALSLSACSSSGNHSNHTDNTNNTTTQPVTPSQPNNQTNQPTTPSQPSNQVTQPTAPNQPNNQVTQPTTPNQPNNQVAQPTEPNQPSNQIKQPTTPTQPSDPSTPVSIVGIPTSGKYNGVAYEYKSGDVNDKIVNPKVHRLSSNNIDVLNVDGKRIDIAPEGVNPGYTYLDKDGETRLSTGAFVNGLIFMSSTRNGIYQNQKDGKTYVYVQGELTPVNEIPRTGEVRYLGLSSYHVNNETLNEGASDVNPPRWGIVGIDMTANFDEKKVNGQLLATGYPDNVVSKLEGKISGNQFSGTKDGTTMQGAFFGKDANEMGGIYTNQEKGFSGAFSAKANWSK